MQKKGLILWLWILSSLAIAQKTKFETYFQNQTLRIDFLHIGNIKTDSIKVSELSYYNQWAGTQSNLIDSFGYGANYIEMYDSTSNKLIYSKGYSSLFEEWRTTPEGKLGIKAFEETRLLPLPIHTVKITFKHRMRNGSYSEISRFYLNPSKIKKSIVKKLPTVVLHQGGNPTKCMDVTFVADGYTIADSSKLINDFKRFTSYFIDCKPYNELKKEINIIGVCSFSKESGITDPNDSVFKNTAVGCTYNSIGSDRYLMTTNLWSLHNIVESTPTDVIVIICNSPKYGGGGIYNYYATVAADDPSGNFVIVHEGGHCIAGLADEYYSSSVTVEDFYPLNVEPWEPNITTLVNFEKKWKDLIDPKTPQPTPDTEEFSKTVGLFEGAGYMEKGAYRPWQSCTMKEIKYDNFCPVCSRAITKMVMYYSK
jgi:hypothetical protein